MQIHLPDDVIETVSLSYNQSEFSVRLPIAVDVLIVSHPVLQEMLLKVEVRIILGTD